MTEVCHSSESTTEVCMCPQCKWERAKMKRRSSMEGLPRQYIGEVMDKMVAPAEVTAAPPCARKLAQEEILLRTAEDKLKSHDAAARSHDTAPQQMISPRSGRRHSSGCAISSSPFGVRSSAIHEGSHAERSGEHADYVLELAAEKTPLRYTPSAAKAVGSAPAADSPSTRRCRYLSTERLSLQGAELNLSNKRLTVEHAPALCDLITNGSTASDAIEKINLNHNTLGDAGATALAKCLATNTTLTSLSLSDNQIGDTGALALAHTLLTNSTLTSLFLARNPISTHGADLLWAANGQREVPMSGLCGLVLD